jgi:hypothetical protein
MDGTQSDVDPGVASVHEHGGGGGNQYGYGGRDVAPCAVDVTIVP